MTMFENDDDDDDDDDEAPALLECQVPARRRTVEAKGKVPVTIVAGFLGSGKTTLLNQCIAQNDQIGQKVALITNEFAETGGFEAALLSDDSAQMNIIEMRNGCVCCSVKDELVQTVEALIEKRPEIEAVVIELSGAANPGIIASRFWLDDALESRLFLDGVVCVVDSTRDTLKAPRAHGGDEARRQLALADLVILTKSDLTTKARLTSLRELITSLNPTARLVSALRGHPLDFTVKGCLIDAGYFASSQILKTPGIFQQVAAPHATAFKSIRLEPLSPTLTLSKLNTFMAHLLWGFHEKPAALPNDDAIFEKRHDDPEDSATVFRVKGLLFSSVSSLAIVQAVYDTYDIVEHREGDSAFADFRQIQPFLVIIGIHLDEDLISRSWNDAFSVLSP